MFHDTRRAFTILFTLQKYNLFRDRTNGEDICAALQALGPLFIKLGQAMSTRPDLIPPNVAASLILLQDKVAPFSGEIAIQSIETALQKPIKTLFAEFDEHPLGSASIAQVHGARLHSGESVVVKVLRPDIEKIIARDVRLLYKLSRFIKTFVPSLAILRLHEVVEEVDKTLNNELDLIRETANSSVLKRNLADMPHVKIPSVYWDYTATRVATLERIHGTCIGDKEALLAQGVDLALLAKTGIELFFRQVFEHRYFHADMHPGNVFINTCNPESPQFILVDFGIMGTLSKTDQNYLAQNLMAFIHRDYRRVAELHIESGWVPKTVRVDEFEAAIRTVCEPMLERSIQDISFGKLLLRLFQTAQQFEMRIQPQLILLQKTILNVEGITRHLYPELNVWDTARPIVESWMKNTFGVKGFLKSVKQDWPLLMSSLPQLPERLMKALKVAASLEQ